MSVQIGPAVPVDDDAPIGLNPRMALIAAAVWLAADDCNYTEVLDVADRFLTWLDSRS